MEFWGIEVKPGETIKCEPGDEKYLHLSQASLGEVKKEKGNENILLNLKFNNKQLVIGTLSADKCPQITYDLVFEKEFELSHNWKNGSVFFVGYKTEIPSDEPGDFMEYTESESEEDTPIKNEPNGNSKSKDELAKSMANALKAEEVKKAKKAEGDDDSDEDDSDEDESDDEDMLDGEDDSSEEDDEDISSEEDETPKKQEEIGKKRAAESALKTPASDKKTKLATPAGGQKTGGTNGKKGTQTATPHPAKQSARTPATNDKSKQQTPKSAGSVPCKSCSKTFKDDNALQAHTRAKHAGK